MKTSFFSKISFALLLFTLSCTDHQPITSADKFTSTDFVQDLVTPFAATVGPDNYLFITQVGTGNNDGKVSAVAPDGSVYPVITGFKSVISPEENLPDGLTHLTYKNGILYVIQGQGGFLYKLDISKWKKTDAAILASSLTPEDIGSFVLKNAPETHLYNLTWGPDGDLFFADAAANAIVRRKSNGDLSIFAKLDQIVNSKPGPPVLDYVPTGIVFDGTKFLVSGLSGGPFIDGLASIREISVAGKVSEYKTNFTTLVDIVLSASNQPLVLSFAKFVAGFQPGAGKVQFEDGSTLLDSLTMPTDIERTGDRSYVIVSMATGKITKLTH